MCFLCTAVHTRVYSCTCVLMGARKGVRCCCTRVCLHVGVRACKEAPQPGRVVVARLYTRVSMHVSPYGCQHRGVVAHACVFARGCECVQGGSGPWMCFLCTAAHTRVYRCMCVPMGASRGVLAHACVYARQCVCMWGCLHMGLCVCKEAPGPGCAFFALLCTRVCRDASAWLWAPSKALLHTRVFARGCECVQGVSGP